ncbi:MAG: glutathione S-transferase family protein [Polyangiaceae bacterium]
MRESRVVATLTLYGTLTSPYVRRVRVVAQELGLDVERIDTATDDGQAALREVNPLWRVPAARVDGLELLDSTTITRYLLQNHGPGPLQPWDLDNHQLQALVTVIDGALDSLINVFYLAKDGVTPASAAYVDKQTSRAHSALSWVESRIPGSWLDASAPLGLGPIALFSAVDWMRFRATYDLAQQPTIARFVEVHAKRPSFVATAPPEA